MAEQYRFGEVVVVEYPYSDGRRTKFRPALVLSSQSDGDLLLARITTKNPIDAFDIALADWQSSKLMAPSAVRLEKLSDLLASRVKSKIGELSHRDKENIIEGIHKFADSLRK